MDPTVAGKIYESMKGRNEQEKKKNIPEDGWEIQIGANPTAYAHPN
jgi:hypothetical protein